MKKHNDSTLNANQVRNERTTKNQAHMSKRINLQQSRRQFMQDVSALGVSTTLLSSSALVAGVFNARFAEAQSVNIPNKTVAVYIPGGAIHDFWAPTTEGADMTMGAMSQGYAGVKTECNFLLNMNHGNAGHGRMPLILSNSWNGDSYDVVMGRELGPNMPFHYVNLGVHSNGNGYLTRDGRSQIPFEDNPFNAFRLLFGTSNQHPRTAILDAHTAALNAIKNQLAGYELQRMDDHLDAISDTQSRLNNLSGETQCNSTPDSTEFPINHDYFSQQAYRQIDIAVAALQCNITRSVSIAFGNHQSQFRIPELGYQGLYHQSIHGGSGGRVNYPHYVEMRNHLGSFTAYLIEKLNTAGVLGSTVVLETTDMAHADLHSATDAPFMIAGGGDSVRRGVTTATNGNYDHWDVLHTSAKACGVSLDFGREIPGVLA